MKKFLVVAGIVLAALILTAGTFSAGFIAGHTMNAARVAADRIL